MVPFHPTSVYQLNAKRVRSGKTNQSVQQVTHERLVSKPIDNGNFYKHLCTHWNGNLLDKDALRSLWFLTEHLKKGGQEPQNSKKKMSASKTEVCRFSGPPLHPRSPPWQTAVHGAP
eukprot:3306973-Amphidinium_carterae.1